MRSLLFAFLLFYIPAIEAQQSSVLLHAFVSDGIIVGYLYGFRIEGNPTTFDRIEIRTSTSENASVIYRIDRNGLYGARGEIEEKIFDDGSHGFFLSVQRPDYVTIDCCRIRKKDNGAMDSITIEWNSNEKRFALLRAP